MGWSKYDERAYPDTRDNRGRYDATQPDEQLQREACESADPHRVEAQDAATVPEGALLPLRSWDCDDSGE